MCLMVSLFLSRTLAVSISGQINDYAAVVSIGSQLIVVDDASAFSHTDKVLIIQMKGAIIREDDDATYGSVSDYGNAGNYEINEVASVEGNTLLLVYPVGSFYDANDIVQVVRIPQYARAEVTAPLTAKAWDGTTGGILALEVTGKLTLSADLNAQAIGFRGGDLNGHAVKGGTTYICPFSSGQGGIKGEGITEVPQAACRGRLANGGGGGNDHNGGGGGGGNYGTGGVGGHGWLSNNPGSLSDIDKGGRGGVPLDTLYELGITKLFLGGGGGGGHQNNGASVPAANGAGIVVLIADTLEAASSVSILANALDATDVHVNDGAGGGGAGGAILLEVNTYINPENLTLDVSGGKGANVYTADQHGPGGGGAGGYVNTISALSDDVTIDTTAGGPGLFISSNPSNPYHNTSHGAVAGTPGAVLTSLFLQVSSDPPTLDLDDETPGTDFQNIFYLNQAAVSIASPNHVEIEDADGIIIHTARIELTNPLDGSDESIQITMSDADLSAYGITVVDLGNDHEIALIGSATLAEYEAVIGSIVYNNTASTPNMFTRSILSIVNDGGAFSNETETLIDILDAILSVTLESASAHWEGNTAVVEWSIQSPAAVQFLVERSLDKEHFEELQQINSRHYATDWRSWYYQDAESRQLPTPELYYRIRMLLPNGITETSDLLELRRPSDKLNFLSVRPHAEGTSLHLRLLPEVQLPAELRILNTNGQVVFLEKIRRRLPEQEWVLKHQRYPAGAYFIRFSTLGKVNSSKFIIR